LHTVIVTELVVLDLTTEGALAAVGLALPDLSGPWPPCQAVGAAAHFLRLGGVLAPSATSNGVVIAVFESHVVPGQLELDSTELIDPAELG
jgi:RES domain-containing protein